MNLMLRPAPGLMPCMLATVILMLGMHSQARAQAADQEALRILTINSATIIPARPGRWWELPALVENRSGETRSATLVATLKNHPGKQFATDFEIDGKTSLRREILIRIPAEVQPGSQQVASVALYERRDGQQVMVTGDGTPMIQDVLFRVSEDRVTTAVMLDPIPDRPFDWDWRHSWIHYSDAMVLRAREVDQLSRLTVQFGDSLPPVQPRVWEGVDNLFIFDDRRLADLSAVSSIRQWLSGGGHAWISLDGVSLDSVHALLGDLWQGEIVQRTALSEYQLSCSLVPDLAGKPLSVQSDHPVPFVKLMQTGGEATHFVDDWPAAIRVSVGKGEAWIVTLGARGWFRFTEEQQGKDLDEPPELGPWIMPILGSFQQPYGVLAQSEVAVSPSLEAVIAEAEGFPDVSAAGRYVDYPVPGRWMVLGSLALFVIATSVVGTWFYRQGKLERFGWCVPLIASLASLPMIFFASSSRSNLVDTLASAQLARLPGGRGVVDIRQSSAVYLSEQQPLELTAADTVNLEPFGDAGGSTNHQFKRTSTGQQQVSVPSWPIG
ncbi:MAG: hypothetical protein AAGA03_06655, partial [Planctomycetota bacterium]